MGDLSVNFSRSEFDCPCGCGYNTPDPALVRGLQLLRERVGVPVRIVSGCRCRAHNYEIGGAPASFHMEGKAADIAVDGMDARMLYTLARQVVQFAGFGVYDTAGTLHVDVRQCSARWCYDAAGRQEPWMENA